MLLDSYWRQRFDLLTIPVTLAMFVALWQLIVWLGDYPAFILPAPADVAASFGKHIANGTLWRHAQVTLFEIFAGLAVGEDGAE